MTSLEGLAPAFRRCVGELGMWSASSLFVATARAAGGEAGVAALEEALGSEFPVLEQVALGFAAPDVTEEVAASCVGLRRLVVVGIESDCLAPLLARLPRTVAVALILDPTFPVDLDRLRAGWGHQVELTDLAAFQRFSGTKSALLTTVYGTDGFRAAVARVWLRCHGDDVRSQFGRLIGWNVLGATMDRFPRWLVETDIDDFTDLIGAP